MSLEMNDQSRQITFKNSVSMDQMSKAMGHFEKAFKLMSGGKTAKYTDFTDWLAITDFVTVGPSMEEVNKRMAEYDEAVKHTKEAGYGSASLLQRRMRIGYARAAELVDAMEKGGIIKPVTEGNFRRELVG